MCRVARLNGSSILDSEEKGKNRCEFQKYFPSIGGGITLFILVRLLWPQAIQQETRPCGPEKLSRRLVDFNLSSWTRVQQR